MSVERPNILFLMCDQLQGAVLEAGHPCHTPNLDRLIERGVRISRGYSPNAVCSPARASLMTGLLPHSHGMLFVHHCQDRDLARLRPEKRHWAQELQRAGYTTGYFGKWHVEHDESPARFGWQVDGSMAGGLYRQEVLATPRTADVHYSLERRCDAPPGYREHVFHGANNVPTAERSMGLTTNLASRFLDSVMGKDGKPWCCFVSVPEPHDPFICHEDSLARYDIDALPLPASCRDPMSDKPGLYRKLARQWEHLTDRDVREAAACYYASITEIDGCFGRLLEQVEAAGELENTIVVLTSDHGELLGAHGLYCKNVGAFEEVYHIPMVLAGPGIAAGRVAKARVGLHDLCPTLLELTGCAAIDTGGESRSFAPLLRDPLGSAGEFQGGYAEYSGGRYMTSQRILWQHPWKFVHNGFDFDELYNLEDDPHEMSNLAEEPAWQPQLQAMYGELWKIVARTGDRALLNTHYPAQRFAAYGPDSTVA